MSASTELTPAELLIIEQALDDRVYWQLSDEHYRNNGYVFEPASDDTEKRKEILDTIVLARKLGVDQPGGLDERKLRRWHKERLKGRNVAHELDCDIGKDCACARPRRARKH